MDIFSLFHQRIAKLLEAEIASGGLPRGLDLARFVVEPPRETAHGDLATNAAMVYAREAAAAKSNPRALAERLVEKLKADPMVAAASVAGPGFVNVTLHDSVLHEVVRLVIQEGENFGAGAHNAASRVNVEYVSANPTGPMHVGHARGAAFGDALANLLTFSGRAVTREYYINDAGAQVDVLARSTFHRYREALGEEVGEVPEGLYPGDYLRPVGVALSRTYGASLRHKPESYWLPIVRKTAIEAMMGMIRADLASLRIEFDVYSSERALTGADGGVDQVKEAIEALGARDLIYIGRLERPKGSTIEDWEDREQTLFRSSRFGDDVDRPLLKSDGSYTYFATDIAYHRTKITRGFAELVDVWGADHGGYVKRMSAAVAALAQDKTKFDVCLCQLVRLMREGEPVKMSKRSGDFVTLREVVDEVGSDAIRFMMLMRKNDAPLDFDLAKVVEQSQNNPVFYVQYGHARASSVMRQAKAALPDLDLSPTALEASDFSALSDPGERALAASLAQFPRVVAHAAQAREPHRIAFYAHDLATVFHAHWNRGKESPHLRFVNENERNLTTSRIALVRAVATVLSTALGMLGVSAPEEMR